MGHGRADAQPGGPQAGPERACRCGRPGPPGRGVRPRQADLPTVRAQGDPPPPPADPSPPPRDGGGHHRRWLLHPVEDPGHDQRLRHRAGPVLVGGPRHVQALEVPERVSPRLQGEQLRVHPVRVGPEVLPRDAARALRSRSSGGSLAAFLHMGAARRDETERDGHERHVRAHCTEGHPARGHSDSKAPVPSILNICKNKEPKGRR